MDIPKIIVITGPTATGKSAYGIQLAKSNNGEVVSADSMQIYRHMDIGTAKPTLDEQLGVPHHMIDIISPHEEYSVSRYVTDASRCVDDIIRRGKMPVIVGGTGLYIESLISGRNFSVRGDDTLRRELEAEYDAVGGEEMLRRLREFDESSAEKLHENDKRRIVRAFETYRLSGKPISQHDAETKALPPKYDAKKLALMYADRAALYAKIDKRVDTMLEMGLRSEVLSLLEMGVPSGCTAMQAIGYKEMVEAVSGKCREDDAVERIKMESRRYAKRQLTWLRRDASVTWVEL